MTARRVKWGDAELRLQRLEDRVAPAAFNTLLTRAEPTLLGDTANGSSFVQFDPTSSTASPQNISADGRYVAFHE